MKVVNKFAGTKYEIMGQYFCDITEELDRLCGLDKRKCPKHYVCIDDCYIKQRLIPIRLPGGTIGDILIDENNVIEKIYINIKALWRDYSDDSNEVLKKYVGQIIEWDEKDE